MTPTIGRIVIVRNHGCGTVDAPANLELDA